MPTARLGQKINVGNAATTVVVVWCISGMTVFGRRPPDCGSGLMFSAPEADLLCDHALERDIRAPNRLGAAVRFGAHLGGRQDSKHASVPGIPIKLCRQIRLAIVSLGPRMGIRVRPSRALRCEE